MLIPPDGCLSTPGCRPGRSAAANPRHDGWLSAERRPRQGRDRPWDGPRLRRRPDRSAHGNGRPRLGRRAHPAARHEPEGDARCRTVPNVPVRGPPMHQGIRLVVYPVRDLTKAKALFREVLGVEAYVDSPYSVGLATPRARPARSATSKSPTSRLASPASLSQGPASGSRSPTSAAG